MIKRVLMGQKSILIGLFIFIGQHLFAQNSQPPKVDNLVKKEVLNSICNALANNYVFPGKANESN